MLSEVTLAQGVPGVWALHAPVSYLLPSHLPVILKDRFLLDGPLMSWGDSPVPKFTALVGMRPTSHGLKHPPLKHCSLTNLFVANLCSLP